MRVLWLVVFVWATIAVAVAIGLRIVPKPLPRFAGAEPTLATVPLPEGLPAPVARWYRDLNGQAVPVVESAVVSGRATLRLMGITFQGRFRFVHDAGTAYRHYLDTTPSACRCCGSTSGSKTGTPAWSCRSASRRASRRSTRRRTLGSGPSRCGSRRCSSPTPGCAGSPWTR